MQAFIEILKLDPIYGMRIKSMKGYETKLVKLKYLKTYKLGLRAYELWKNNLINDPIFNNIAIEISKIESDLRKLTGTDRRISKLKPLKERRKV